MKKFFNKRNNGITLIALIITIIVLLILAGVAVATLTGENGLLEKTRIAAENTKVGTAKEKVEMVVCASYDTSGKLVDKNLKSNLQAIEGFQTLEGFEGDVATYDVSVTVDGYKFLVSELGVVTYSEENTVDTGEDAEGVIPKPSNTSLSYIVKNNNVSEADILEKSLNDLSGNSNSLKLTDVTLNEDNSGLVFNGTSSYGEIDLKSSLTFPLTLEFLIETNYTGNQIIFSEPNSKTTLQIYLGYFVTSIDTSTYTHEIPNDFFDGTKKHVIIKYNSLDDANVYVNGQVQPKKGEKNASNNNVGTNVYIGRRYGGMFFKGILYEAHIYNKALTENEILSRYNTISKYY